MFSNIRYRMRKIGKQFNKATLKRNPLAPAIKASSVKPLFAKTRFLNAIQYDICKIQLYNEYKEGSNYKLNNVDNIKELLSDPDRDKYYKKQKEERAAEQERIKWNNQLSKLDNLVGISGAKEEVKNLVNLAKANKSRREQGLKPIPMSLHLVFTGNPGTGKTTVARLLGQLYKELGVLSKGQLVEVTRTDLVGQYVGDTAPKTQKKIDEAKGGILFIDEAYTLAKGGNDFGQEAIDTLLAEMENNRDDLVVIVAGYPNEMTKFINSNPGLQSRFNKYIEFEDFSAEELVSIFYGECRKYNYKLTQEAIDKLRNKMQLMVQNKGANFGNGRDVRNFFERTLQNHNNRIYGSDGKEDFVFKEADIA